MAGRVLLGHESWRHPKKTNACSAGAGAAKSPRSSRDRCSDASRSPGTTRSSMASFRDVLSRSANFIGKIRFCSRSPSDVEEFVFDSGAYESVDDVHVPVSTYVPLNMRGSAGSVRFSRSGEHSKLPPEMIRTSSNLSASQTSINWVAAVPPEERISKPMYNSNCQEAGHHLRRHQGQASPTSLSTALRRHPTIRPDDFADLGGGIKSFKMPPLLAYVIGRDHEDNTNPQLLSRNFFMNAWRDAPVINLQYDINQGLTGMVFSPVSRVMMLWDLVLLYGVLWTLVFTPLEIAFPLAGASGDASSVLKGCNILVNIIFVIDILVQFNLAFDDRDANGSRHVTNRWVIASRYIRGRLLVDVLCAFPFWLFVDNLGVVSTPLATIKLFRLFRVMRLTRGNFITTRPIMPYWMRTCIKLASMTIFAAHVFSCVWAALANLNAGCPTWLDRLASEKVGLDDSMRHSMLTVYLWSAYFSITLITTVGFGDVTPQNDLECAVAMLGVMCGSVIWAYILSSLFSVLAQMDPHRTEFESMMDELWCMTSDHSIPGPLLYDVQQYFSECEDIWKLAQRRSSLMSRMSPNLRGRMSLALCGEWIGKISYIRELFLTGIPATTGFVAEIACKLEAKVFSPGEKLANALYIIRKGLIAQGCRVYSVGDVCGEDFMVQNPRNRISFMPLALTTVGTLTLSCEDFAAILSRFPEHAMVVRYYTNWLAVKYGIGRVLRQHALGESEMEQTRTASSTMLGILRWSSRDTDLTRSAFA